MNRLAQTGDKMFERNIAIIASRKQEVRVFSDGFIYVGFLCGLDDDWIQIYGHEDLDSNDAYTKWRYMLILKNNVSAIGPTGNSINDYDGETQQWIDDKIKVFAKEVAGKFVSVRSTKNDRREEV